MITEKHICPNSELDKICLQYIICWCTAISPLVGFVSLIPFVIPFVHVHASIFIHSRPFLFILSIIPFIVIDRTWAVEVKNKHASKYDAAEFLELSKSFAPCALNKEKLSWGGLLGHHAVKN